MNRIKHFFGWLFLTRSYLDTLTDEQIAVRALGKRWAYQFEQGKRDVAHANELLASMASRYTQKGVTIVFAK